MIAAEGVSRTFGHGGVEHRVLRDVDLDVGSDEFVAVMGPSGCGKSTLLGLLGGLDLPDDGTVRLGGTVLSALGEEPRATIRRERIGIVFQQFHLIPSLTVLENVALTAIVSGVRPRQWRRRAIALVEDLDIADLAARRPEHLSGGEQQRVAIARALFHRPEVLLADEPTGSLDSANGERVLQLFSAARRAGELRSLVMVTHDADAASTADRVVFLRDGSVVDEIPLGRTEGVDRAERVRLRLARTAR